MPILALDMYEHAYHLDFGAAAGAYVDAFMRHIDWAAVYTRYQQAVFGASQDFGATPGEAAAAQLIDVRRAAVYDRADTLIAGSRWRDPAAVSAWAAELQRGAPTVVYCVYGHEVSRAVVLRLRALGHDARFLRGGIEAWQQAGLALQPKGG